MGNDLYALPFDIETLDVTAGSFPIVEGVFNTTSFLNYSISNSGMLAYVPGDSTALNQCAFVWVDREGNEKLLDASPNSYYDYFKISPDGTRVALTIIRGAPYDLWIRDPVRETVRRFTFTGSYNGTPIWTPDGQRVIFDSRREGERESIYWKPANGSGKAELIASVPNGDMWPASISSDGKILFFGENVDTETSRYNIGMLSMEGDQSPKLLLQEKYDEYSSQISPDSR